MVKVKGARASVVKAKRKAKKRREFDKTAEVAAQQLIFDVQYVIEAVLRDQGLTRRALADRLGRSEATISRELDEDSNLTLRTIAKLAVALEDEFRVSSRHFEQMKAEGKVHAMYEPATSTIATTVTTRVEVVPISGQIVATGFPVVNFAHPNIARLLGDPAFGPTHVFGSWGNVLGTPINDPAHGLARLTFAAQSEEDDTADAPRGRPPLLMGYQDLGAE